MLPFTSDEIGKPSMFWRTDFRPLAAVCGEIATSEARALPEFLVQGYALNAKSIKNSQPRFVSRRDD
jgi:hypothetical protein